MAASSTVESSDEKPPVLSLQDLTIVEAFDPGATEAKYVTFYQVTPEDELYFGQLFKKKKEITLSEYSAALEHVPDSEIYPTIPQDTPLTIAPDDLDDVSAFIKRPGLNCYEEMKGSDFIPKGVLEETLIMEQVSQTPHPSIVGYRGCRVRRGRITALVLQRLDKTLQQHALESAVAYLHSLGLAHNDINPGNIMARRGMPVLIDFGSCQPFGGRLQSLGTPGWYEEVFFTSQAKHDLYALRKLRKWLEKPE
ncbi:hypothetical protein LLEC1_04214 [Akanthomyces lecanii]|uniref:Protein kinase domain-containing protein n=1 Tax=Cordyceps confragosa TaxID=2714763 RepID=A0A179I3Y1_CORDF|nr:hypothetical protein LLEC1_04214 [Akanthomyces lecanii]